MFKMILGGALVLGLVGYGVISPDQIQAAGNKVKDSVTWMVDKVDEQDFEGWKPPKVNVTELGND